MNGRVGNQLVCDPLEIMEIDSEIYFVKAISGHIYLDFPVMTMEVLAFTFISP